MKFPSPPSFLQGEPRSVVDHINKSFCWPVSLALDYLRGQRGDGFPLTSGPEKKALGQMATSEIRPPGTSLGENWLFRRPSILLAAYLPELKRLESWKFHFPDSLAARELKPLRFTHQLCPQDTCACAELRKEKWLNTGDWLACRWAGPPDPVAVAPRGPSLQCGSLSPPEIL